MKKVTGAGGIFYCRSTKRFLFLLRDDSKYKHKWGFPGGKVEESETIVRGLEREIIEELGIMLNIEKIIPIELYLSKDKGFEYGTYICIVENEFLSESVSTLCWADLGHLPKNIHIGLKNTLNNNLIRTKIETVLELHNDSIIINQ